MANNPVANAFNIDMVYSWQVAPGSFFTAVWKNQIYSDSDELYKGFFDNLTKSADWIGKDSAVDSARIITRISCTSRECFFVHDLKREPGLWPQRIN